MDENVLKKKTSSALFIDAHDILIRLETSPFDIYLASDLREYDHWRRTVNVEPRNCSFLPRGRSIYSIDSDIKTHIDKRMDLLSVIRKGSEFLERREMHCDLSAVAKFCAENGNRDNGSRQRAAWTMNFGVKGELSRSNIEPSDDIFYGSKQFSKISDHHMRETVKQSIANAVDYIWLTANDMQKALNKNPMGMDVKRATMYGKRVSDIFGCVYSQFECVTIVVLRLTSNDSGQCDKHKDKMNDTLPAYRKTACMCVVLSGEQDDLYLLQFICNFRGSVGKLCSDVNSHHVDNLIFQIRDYHQILRKEYAEKFPRKDASFLENPVDIDSFYLDQSVLSVKEPVANQSSIEKTFIKLTIGTSRILSMSGFLAPVYDNIHKFSFRQLIEIFFFASFLATPATFNHSFRFLFEGDGSPTNVVGHPLFKLCGYMTQTFGSMSAGVHPRYSPCNKSIIDVFGTSESEDGISKLDETVNCLLSWIFFVDSHKGKKSAKEIPLHVIHSRMESTLSEIKCALGDKSLDFGLFRLSIFTVLASGIGLCEPGEHLHQFFFPMKGSASCNHLNKPMSTQLDIHSPTALIDDFIPCSNNVSHSLSARDQLMESVAFKMSWKPFHRDQVELHLCESMPNRCLGLKDIFVVGDNIFHLASNGVPRTKKFGSKKWLDVDRSHVLNEKQKVTLQNRSP